MRKTVFFTLSLCLLPLAVSAQPNWGLRSGIGVEKKITKGLDAGVDVKYYQTDNFRNTDRWSIGLSVDKRLYRNEAKTFNVKVGLGYKYMNVYHDWSTKYKGDKALDIEDGLDPNYYRKNNYSFNLSDSYVDRRHRLTASLQASYELGRLKISLRETYQFTHTDSATYAKDKYRYELVDPADESKNWSVEYNVPDGKPASDKGVVRSRISVDYDIPHWKYDPFVSYEIFNGVDNGHKTEKSRITAGVDFSFNKMHNFEVAFMWQNQHDNDEPAGSFICLSYKIDL